MGRRSTREFRACASRARSSQGITNYVLLALAFSVEATFLCFGINSLRASHPQGPLLDALRRCKDPAVFTVVAEDIAALAGLISAFVGVLLSQLFHSSLYGAVGSIAVGLNLMVVAVFLTSESRKLLVGESGGKRLVKDAKHLARAEPDVLRVGDALSMQRGPDQVRLNLGRHETCTARDRPKGPRLGQGSKSHEWCSDPGLRSSHRGAGSSRLWQLCNPSFERPLRGQPCDSFGHTELQLVSATDAGEVEPHGFGRHEQRDGGRFRFHHRLDQ